MEHFSEKLVILLVEDNEDEVFIMKRAFRKANIKNPLHVVDDGMEALSYLQGVSQFTDRGKYPLPRVVFLDLNLPKMSGLEVLTFVKKQPQLRHLTINILSSSTRPSDITTALELGANAYFVKPAQVEKFQELIESWYRRSYFEVFP